MARQRKQQSKQPAKTSSSWGLLFRIGIGLVLLVTCSRMIADTSSSSAQPAPPKPLSSGTGHGYRSSAD